MNKKSDVIVVKIGGSTLGQHDTTIADLEKSSPSGWLNKDL
jgi:hypothetical protein